MQPATAVETTLLGTLLAEATKLNRAALVAALQEEFPDFEIETGDSVPNLRAALATLRLRREVSADSTDDEPEAPEEAEVEVVADGPDAEAEAVADEVGKALALREGTPAPQSALPSVAEFNASMAVADRIAQTSFVPVAYRGKPNDVMAAILFGREIGLGPMQSLRDVYMVDGRPALAAHLQLALLRRGGIRILESEATRERAFIRAQRTDTGEIMAVEWTYEEAEKIKQKSRGGGTTMLVDKDNWRNYPADMLFARCVGRLTRRLGSDLIGGLPPYVAEEAADFSGWGVEYGEGGDINLRPGQQPPAVRQENAGKVETPRSWAEIAEWAKPYGDEIGWGEWVRDASDRLYGIRDLASLSVDQKRALSIKAAGAIVKLRDTVDPGRFPAPNREEIQRAWAAVLDGEILPGPGWRLDPKEAEFGAPTYYEFHGLPEPEAPTEEAPADALRGSVEEERPKDENEALAGEDVADAEWTAAGDGLDFGGGYEG